MGLSFYWDRPVNRLVGERLMLTMIMSFFTLLFVYAMAIPIGIYSAVRQYSLADYVFTFIGFIGLATPNFLLALVFMYIGIKVFNASAGGLFSTEYLDADWSVARGLGHAQAHVAARRDRRHRRHRRHYPRDAGDNTG